MRSFVKDAGGVDVPTGIFNGFIEASSCAALELVIFNASNRTMTIAIGNTNNLIRFIESIVELGYRNAFSTFFFSSGLE